MADEVRELVPREALLEQLLQKAAKDRAVSLRYNRRSLALSYGTLAVVVLLEFLGVNVLIVATVAVVGLVVFLFFTGRQGQKLEKQLYQEEMHYYKELIDIKVMSAAGADYAGEMPLSQRELEILGLIAKGNMNKEIARILGLSTNTAQIMKKMEVDDRTSAAVIAISRGWIKN
jgi:DNA-binding CsgD family transcriptional regulator